MQIIEIGDPNALIILFRMQVKEDKIEYRRICECYKK